MRPASTSQRRDATGAFHPVNIASQRGDYASGYHCDRPMQPTAPQPALTEDSIREALRDCYDPEVPVNIVDLGLVYRVAVAPDPDAPGTGIPGVPPRHRVAIDLTLTSPGCPAHEQIVAQIENRLSAFESVSRTSVALVWKPRWTPQRISAEGRKHLGID
jgi:metal-sulfur cluster biosynthetic enzyme